MIALLAGGAFVGCSNDADPKAANSPTATVTTPAAIPTPAPQPSPPPEPAQPDSIADPAEISWAEVLDAKPDPAVVTNEAMRARIEALGLPWRVRDRRSGVELLLVPPGEFLMGAGDSDSDAQNAEKPAHLVTITKPFYLGRFEVTQLEWERVRNSNPSSFFAPRLPVQRVTFGEVILFLESAAFRLPTEAEWEYACRGGSTDARYGELDLIARYEGNSNARPGLVGERPANALGFHDMLGNAMEWCGDYFQGDYYAQCKAGVTDPTGPHSGTTRVMRGGSWAGIGKMSRASYRYGVPADYRGDYLGDGLRVARDTQGE